MITIQQNEDKYEVRFRYDKEIVELIKNVPGKSWNPNQKFWTIPKDRLGMLIAQFKATPYESQIKIISDEHLNENAVLAASGTIPENIDLSDVHYRIQDGCMPFKHQIDSMKYYKGRRSAGCLSGFILADEPGAGKTLEVTNIGIYKKETQGSKHCLIITCVNSAKYNWRDDIDKHTNGEFEGYILGTRIKRNGDINDNATSLGKFEDLVTEKKYGGKKSDESLPYFLILNIEALRFKKGKNYLITEELIRKINEGYIDMIAIDEIHVNASPSSTQGSQLLALKNKSSRRIEWFPMTGTPITNKPTDLFTPLRLIDAHQSTSYWSWCQSFCIYGGIGGHDIIGYKNVASLKAMLEPNMLRRLKKDILDLPEKINNVVYVENSSYQDKLYSQVQSGILSQRDEIIHSMNPMTELLKLRQVNGSPELIDEACKVDKNYLNKNSKMKTLISMIETIMTDTDEKLIVFSMFVEPLRTLYRLIGNRYKVCSYTGTMSQTAREAQKHQFINNSDCRILIGTYQALGTSHTLVAANNVFFYDEAWVPTTMQQAEDRVHRPGQTNAVNLYRLITKDTIDEHVHKILYKKKGISSYIVDNIDIRSNPELFDLLLSH